MPPHKDILLPNHYYHIYNRAVGDEKIFRNKENYRYFLQKFIQHIFPVADIYCYCLLPNHFHFLVRIKPADTLSIYYYERKKKIPLTDNSIINEFLMEQFSNFFNSYTKSINKIFDRKGKLFMDHLKRKEITADNYFSKIIHYIHANPVHHGYCKKVSNWNHSSYHILIDESETILKRDEVMDWFGNKDNFIKFHEQSIHIRDKNVFKP